MATLWKAMDPRGKIGAREGRKQLEGYLGRSLTGDDVGRIQQFWGLQRPLTENDEYTGDDWNSLLKWGAGQAGGTYEDWRDPIDPGGQGRPIPPSTPTQTGPKNTAPQFEWDEVLDAPTPRNPGKFQYDPFVGPDADAMKLDPGYQFRLKEGQRAVEASKASKGLFKSGETLMALEDYGQGMASQEYSNVWDRAKTTYDTNRFNARDSWDTDFDLAKFEYQPQFATWQARTGQNAVQNMAEFNQGWDREQYYNDDELRRSEIGRDERWRQSDDQWRKETFNRDDSYRRMVQSSDDEFRRAVQAESERWKRELMIEDRLRFLSTLGR